MSAISRMATLCFIGAAVLIALLNFTPICYLANTVPEISKPNVAPGSYGKLPLLFEANHGQVDQLVKFMARGSGYNLYLTPNEAVLTLAKRTVRMTLIGGNNNADIEGVEQQAARANYFIGNDRDKWRTNIPTYEKIKYADVYPGVDLLYYGNQRQLEFDFVVAPGANADRIRLDFHGAQTLRLDAKGDLILQVPGGELRQKKPIAYQEVNGLRRHVDARFVLKGKHQVGFEIADYDREKPLIIDPVLIYSTYLGGNAAETGNDIAVDTNGNAYITGFTASNNFPTANPFQPTFRGTNDAFVTKLNATGTAVIYSTYLGGSGNDQGQDITVDAAGNAYVTGFTTGNFPTMNPVQANVGGGFDAFVTKLNPTGSALVYSTYLGGSGNEQGFGTNEDLAVDPEGNVYVTGRTNSTNFPLVNPLQPVYGGGTFDAFVTKINNAGSAFVYSTYLGGSNDDRGYGIAVNSSGNAYLTGVTFSNNFPLANPLDSTLAGPFDAFVAKLNETGTALVYSTYLGGNDQEHGFGGDIAVDASGNAYVTGSTGSTDFPTVNPIQPTRGQSHDVFVTKINPAGTALIYSTYLGGTGTDAGTAIAVDTNGNAYVTGFSSGLDFPTVNALDNTRGGSSDAIVAKLNPTGTAVVFSTYFGGSSQETGNAIAVDGAGNAYVAGDTNSIDLQTAIPFQPFLQGNSDAFVIKIFDSSIFSVEAILPNRGGNNGDVSASVLGAGFQPGATVKLQAQGEPDIEGADPQVVNSSRITATFDLRGAAAGPRDVVVTQPGGSAMTLRDGFTIEDGGSPHLWVEILGRNQVRQGEPANFQILIGNSGNIDMDGMAILQLSVPNGVSEVKAKYKGLDVGTFISGVALEPNIATGQNSFFAETSQIVVTPWTVGEIPAQSQVVITANMTPFQSGALGAEVVLVPRERMADTVYLLLKAKAQELETEFPSLSDAFVSAFKAALAQTLKTSLKELTKPNPDNAKIFFNQPDMIFRNAFDDTAALRSLFPDESAALNAALIRMQTPNFSFLLFSNYRRLVPRPQPVLPVKKLIQIVNSHDPNEKIGSLGVNGPRYVSGEEPLRYAVYFENLATATAPAQEIVITDQLDLTNLQLNSFRFNSFAFGDKVVVPPPGGSEFISDVDLRPDMNLIVKIVARLNIDTGLVTWRFTSIDPDTGIPPEDPLAGFLPPGEEGNVAFTVFPKSNLPTGTVINNAASIVFDKNAALQTPTWSNTLDNSTPVSEVVALTAAACSANVNVQWSGTDTGSGIRDYTVFVSDNGGPFTVWLENSTATSGVYLGQFGHTYSFYSVAQDQTGNTESAPALPDASVTIQTPAPPEFTSVPAPLTVYTGPNATECGVLISDMALGTATVQSSCPVNVRRDGVPNGNVFPVGNTTLTYTATDALGNTVSTTQIVTVVDNTPPTLIVPALPATSTDNSCQTTIPDVLSVVTASDNCAGPITLTQNPAAGTLVGPGKHTITVTAIDAAGNARNVTTTFNVGDAPVFLISVTPATVKRGNKVTLNASFKNCINSAQTVTLKLSLTNPGSNTSILTLPVTLQAGQSGGFSLPLTIPKSTPAGLYVLTLDIYVNGIKTRTTTAQLMVTQ